MTFLKHLALLIALLCSVGLMGCGESVHEKTAGPVESEAYPNADLLVSTSWLAGQLGAQDLVLIDARNSGYDSAHIPGAIHMPHAIFADDTLNIKPVPELEALLTATGISADQTIVIYDDTVNSWGAAGRIFWILESLGCQNVHLLNGGWDKWAAEERTTQTAPAILPAAATPFVAQVKPQVTTDRDYIASRLGDADFAIIDSRTDEEFNGWQLYGEVRGGHIQGAVHIPYEWFFDADRTVLGYDDLKTLLKSRGITSDKEISAYCTAGIRSGFVYFALRLMGYPSATNYDASMWDWASGDAETYPMDKLPNYDKLVYSGWVKKLIDGDLPESGKYVIVQTGWGPAPESYQAEHIPGAIWVNSDEIEYDDYIARDDFVEGQWPGRSTTAEQDAAKGIAPDQSLPKNYWNIYPDEYLIPGIAHMGIDKKTTVVVYGADMTAAGRLVWTLMYAGVEDVRLYNGSLANWKAAGYATESGLVERTPAAIFDLDFFDANGADRNVAAHPEYRVETPYVRDVANDLVPDAVIADIRSWEEYIGASAPYSYIPTDGRIAGALFGYAGSDPWKMEDFIDEADGTLRSFAEVDQRWADAGITRDRTVSFYCGTGWRAALTWFYTYLMGWENVNLYDGGWYEWSMGSDVEINPIFDAMPNLPAEE